MKSNRYAAVASLPPDAPPETVPVLQSMRDQEMQGRCKVTIEPDGTGLVTFKVDPFIMNRIKTRLGGLDLATYMYENILYRACVDHVY